MTLGRIDIVSPCDIVLAIALFYNLPFHKTFFKKVATKLNMAGFFPFDNGLASQEGSPRRR